MNLLFPAGLALGALAVPLIGLYFLRIRRQRVRVPSLLLWQEVAKVQALATPFERFRKSLLLLLQLLLLLLLTLALARPYLEDEFEAGRSLVLFYFHRHMNYYPFDLCYLQRYLMNYYYYCL